MFSFFNSTHKFKLFLKSIVLLGLVAFFFLIVYVLVVISDIPQHRLKSVAGQTHKAKQKRNKIKLEKGSLVQENDLNNILLFSSNPLDGERWKKDKIDQKLIGWIIGPHSKQFEILEDIEIDSFYKNDCGKVYCYQHRMAFELIPSIFWKGLIGIEDNRFLDHFGIDLKSILRAIVIDLVEMKMVQGASTLTQQLVRNLFYSNEKTFRRKFKEVISSIYIELNFSKENILEAYFNEAYWGGLGGIRIKGLYAASTFYFSKKPSEIDPYEASILIAMLKGPNYFSPIRHLERIKKRTGIVFRKLVSLNLFPSQYVNPWPDKKWESWRKKIIKKVEVGEYVNLWRISLANGKTLPLFEHYVLLQKISKVNRFVKKRSSGQDFAVKIIMGEPLASLNKEKGSEDKYFTFYSKFERLKKAAIEKEKHQIGSTIKPILYRIFLDNGKSFDDHVDTSEIELKLKSGSWSPRESHEGIPAEVTLGEALATSLNRPVIRISKELGFDLIEQKLKPQIPSLLSPLSEFPAQLLGSLELSVMGLYQLYKDFILKECSLIKKTNKNRSQFEQTKKPDSILELLSDPKRTTVRKAIGQHMKNMSFFGKTGTSNNGHDSWFVFYEGRRLGVIWVGLEGRRKKNSEIRLYGSNTSFKIFEEFYRDRGRRFSEFSCASFP